MSNRGLSSEVISKYRVFCLVIAYVRLEVARVTASVVVDVDDMWSLLYHPVLLLLSTEGGR